MKEVHSLTAAQVFEAVSFGDAVYALDSALRTGLDPSSSITRSVIDVAHGQLLLMPAEIAAFTGVKIASVTPNNPSLNLPRIQATYLLMDAETLSVQLVLDGTALTTLRTPALSAVAVDHLADSDASRVVVFGAGPQAWGHVRAICTVRDVQQVTVIARRIESAQSLVDRLAGDGIHARAMSGRASAEMLSEADIIACTTTAALPLFDSAALSPSACVIAVGSHERDQRELDSALMARAHVVVEDAQTALQEAGDVIIPVEEGALDPTTLVSIADLVTGRAVLSRDRPCVFKSVGQGWQDLVIAAAVHSRVS